MIDIAKIHISNFKRIQDVDIHLRRLNYIVGGNSSGKTSVLQAIHMGVSCAQIQAELGQTVIAESELRYSPAADFVTLGNGSAYENRKDGARGAIEFFGTDSQGHESSYRVEIYKARNHKNIGIDRSGTYNDFGQYISDYGKLFSVYVPGLAGVPHREEFRGYASVFRKAAGGEANLVLRNIIRLITERQALNSLEFELSVLLGPTKIYVAHDPDRDEHVVVKLAFRENPTDRDFVPLEMCGTGVTQLLQIFAYVLLFRPRLLLLDEPDSHLHPSKQAMLAEALAQISDDYDCSILAATHSRHMLTASESSANIIWMNDGTVQDTAPRKLAEILLQLGALDQIDSGGADIIVCTEDERTETLQEAIAAIGSQDHVSVISYNGFNNAGNAEAFRSMADLMPTTPRVIVHRDRDFLTDEELAEWGKPFWDRGIEVFVPNLCDIECHFVSAKQIADVYEKSVEEAEALLNRVSLEQAEGQSAKFFAKRRDAVKKFWPDGGAPATQDLWDSYEEDPEMRMYGKGMIKAIQVAARNAGWGHRDLLGVPADAFVNEARRMLRGNSRDARVEESSSTKS